MTTSQLVSPADIQNALNRIWESLETTNVARACLFNLIFYTQKNPRTAYIQKIAQKVIEKFPSRVIFITLEPNEKDDFLKTEVSILSSSKGEFDVACDYIQINASPTSKQRVPSIVLPHILSDLPVFLILADNPSQEDILCNQLKQLADRLIFDSESTDNLPRFASSLLTYKDSLHCDIADLNWARIQSWREMLSLAFYSPENLNQIQRCKKIDILYNSHETPFFCHTRLQSLYLQAWLACQLEWQFQSTTTQKNTIKLIYQAGNHPIEMSLSSKENAALPPGIILSVVMQTLDDEHFSFLTDEEHSHQITFQHSARDKCNMPSHYIFTKAESGQSLVKEICHRGTSEHFLKVLNLLKKLGQLC